MAKKFNGVVNIDVRDSVPDWTPFRESPAPEGAPNVLVVLYDDTGLAAWSPYGGRINMPTMQKLADNGLTYTQWHTTALCSPTRSCLLTGRNHHQNGFAQIAEGAQGFPGHTGHIPMENATIGEVLRENGYNTYWVGKNHNVPLDEWAVGATRRNWPLARGFDRYYGFIGGETNNWYPTLAEDNHYVDQPYLPEEGYHLSKDLADKAISYIADSKTSAPKKPWYLWFCPGANHAPHHAPEEYIAKYAGQFDDGYEAYREWVLPRMVERGILPEGTGLTEINPLPGEAAQPMDHVRPWDDPVGRGEEALRPLRRGVRRVLGVHRRPGRSDHRLPRGDRPAREHHRHVRRRQRRVGRGQPGRHGQREQVLQRLPRGPRAEHVDARRARLAGRRTTTTRPGGRPRSRRRSRCSSATPTRAASPTRW